jgi:hypothetical protein
LARIALCAADWRVRQRSFYKTFLNHALHYSLKTIGAARFFPCQRVMSYLSLKQAKFRRHPKSQILPPSFNAEAGTA